MSSSSGIENTDGEPNLASRPDDHHGFRVDVADGDTVVTWRDLTVTVPNHEGPILESITGYAGPGVLAIMGPTGSGKTTLLNALAGRTKPSQTMTGTILINGQKEQLAFGTSAYVTQDDLLLTTLTVRETVRFSARLQLPDSMRTQDKLRRADETIESMGLAEAADRKVKYISGGEKRRLSICIEILTHPRLLFMDEPTSGLDSAASFHVMNRITQLARANRHTVVLSIHQPSSNVLNLFDNLCLLADGKTVYFGQARQMTTYFNAAGYACPAETNPADHYLDRINTDFSPEAKVAVNNLVGLYTLSENKKQVEARVPAAQPKGDQEEREQRNGGHAMHAGFLSQCCVLTWRSAVNMWRENGYYWLRFYIYLAIAFCLGTIFYQLDISYSTIEDRSSVLQFLGGYLTFMTIGGFPSFVEDVKIFEKERLNGHYGVGVYVLSHTLSSAPFLIAVSVIPGVITYYMAGLQPSASHFFYFSLVLFMLMTLVESLMMMIASVISDFLYGIILGAGVQGMMMLTSGFFRKPKDIPNPVWKYPCYYIAFHKYGGQGFFKNEFYGLTFPNKEGSLPPTLSGRMIVEYGYEMEVGYSKWVDLLVLVGMVVVYRFLFFFIHKVKEYLASRRANNNGRRSIPTSNNENERR